MKNSLKITIAIIIFLLTTIQANAWTYSKLEKSYQDLTSMVQTNPFYERDLKYIRAGGSCATRLSNAFNRAGYRTLTPNAFKAKGIRTIKDKNGKRYVMGAQNLGKHLGLAKAKYRIKNIDAIKGKKGIILFENYHIDLWTGSQMYGNGSVYAGHYLEKVMYFMPLK